MAIRATYLLVYVALLVLLGITMAVSQLQLGLWNPVVNLSIAALKAGLIAWFFMHLDESSALVRIFAIAAILWVSGLFIGGLTDWLTRPWAG